MEGETVIKVIRMPPRDFLGPLAKDLMIIPGEVEHNGDTFYIPAGFTPNGEYGKLELGGAKFPFPSQNLSLTLNLSDESVSDIRLIEKAGKVSEIVIQVQTAPTSPVPGSP
jgi:hypothetical protein